MSKIEVEVEQCDIHKFDLAAEKKAIEARIEAEVAAIKERKFAEVSQ